MRTFTERASAWLHSRPHWLLALVAITLVVVVGNAMYLSGLTNNDPIATSANISRLLCNVACGRTAIDPNVGFITEALGRRAASDLLHFHLPFWNQYEGVGSPLLGEMQVAAFFPLTLFFVLNSGLLWFHVLLELIAGYSTYFLARRLGLARVAAVAAGALFALNGTYAWLGNAVLNPVAFLPMLLLGIEIIIAGAGDRRRHGWYLVAIALCLSILAGFPEVAYLDGLLAGVWALTRLVQLHGAERLRTLARLAVGAVVGVALALPALIPFYDYLKVANVGNHAANFATSKLPSSAFGMFFDPYVYGTLFSNGAVTPDWGSIGGYFTISVTVLAILGLFGRERRALRLVLGGWVLLCGLASFDLAGLHRLFNLIPLVKNSAFPRYIAPSMEMAMIMLCAFALHDLVVSEQARERVWRVALLGLALLALITWRARGVNADYHLSTKANVIFHLLQAAPFVVLIVLLFLSRSLTRARGKARSRAIAMVTLLVVAESVFMFAVPSAEAPKSIQVDQTAISFLQDHLGSNYRFYDFGAIDPNWGSFYGINELSAIDLPIPKNFTDYIQTQLFPGMTPNNQFIARGGIANFTAEVNAFVTHFAAYERAGVKYVTVPAARSLTAAALAKGLHAVYQDDLITIYETPTATPLFSAGPHCRVTSTDYDHATVTCPASGGTLVREEDAMKGWHATVNAQPVDVATVNGIFQSIPVPAGTSTVVFSFTPPHELGAFAVAFLAALFLLFAWWWERRARRARGSESPLAA